MTLRVHVSPPVLEWAIEISGRDPEELIQRFPRLPHWVDGTSRPTLRQAQELARIAGIPFGTLLLRDPPRIELPVPDFREGLAGDLSRPSSDLLAVVHQSIRRQDWFREYAEENGLPPVRVVGSGAGLPPREVAARMTQALEFNAGQRRGGKQDVRKHLLRAFERLGGLTVATSMVENNTHRLLDPDEFRGFALVDHLAPLVFVNTNQSMNGQLFTLAHEFAHVWQGSSGISLEDPNWEPQSDIERWCNSVASYFLVPPDELHARHRAIQDLGLTARLDSLAQEFKCGTLVVLIALRRDNLCDFADFDSAYQAEVERLKRLDKGRPGAGGNHYDNQPFRIGERFSRAIITDALAGHTPLTEALRLTSLKSLSSLDTYAERLGVA